MKNWLAILLLCITTAGTFIPCCAVDDCYADQVTNNQHNDHKSEGACSPFFACSTCPGFVELTKAIQLPLPVAQTTIHQQALVVFQLTTYAASFWQPPRDC